MKYKNWLNEWLALYVKPITKIRTYKKYQRQIELHILPALGEFELQDLTATVLQRFTVDLSEKRLSANTVNGIISACSSKFFAISIGFLRVYRKKWLNGSTEASPFFDYPFFCAISSFDNFNKNMAARNESIQQAFLSLFAPKEV